MEVGQGPNWAVAPKKKKVQKNYKDVATMEIRIYYLHVRMETTAGIEQLLSSIGFQQGKEFSLHHHIQSQLRE
jgi:hypothetical protein